MARTQKTIQAIMQNGEATEFWQLICSELDKDIKSLQRERDSDEIAGMPAVEYKLAMENIKDKIKLLSDLKKKPQTIIQNLENIAPEDDDADPYEK